MLKCQRFKYSENKTIELKILKHLYVNVYNNKKRQNSKKYQDKDDKYIFLFFVSKKS